MGLKADYTAKSESCFKKICLEDKFATTKDIKSMLQSSDIHASESTEAQNVRFTVQSLQEAKIVCCYESETKIWASGNQ